MIPPNFDDDVQRQDREFNELLEQLFFRGVIRFLVFGAVFFTGMLIGVLIK